MKPYLSHVSLKQGPGEEWHMKESGEIPVGWPLQQGPIPGRHPKKLRLKGGQASQPTAKKQMMGSLMADCLKHKTSWTHPQGRYHQ